jgi:hypothetical protein
MFLNLIVCCCFTHSFFTFSNIMRHAATGDPLDERVLSPAASLVISAQAPPSDMPQWFIAFLKKPDGLIDWLSCLVW